MDDISLKGFRYTSDKENKRILFGLVYCFFDSENDKPYVRRRLATLQSPVKTRSLSNRMTLRASNDNYNTKIAHNTALRLKKDDKFSGKLDKDIIELIATFMEAALNYELSAIQKLKYFHDLYFDDARRFYRTYGQPKSATHKEACIKMQKGYSSVAHQKRVRKYHQNLSIAAVMEKKFCNVSEALEELLEIMTNFAP